MNSDLDLSGWGQNKRLKQTGGNALIFEAQGWSNIAEIQIDAAVSWPFHFPVYNNDADMQWGIFQQNRKCAQVVWPNNSTFCNQEMSVAASCKTVECWVRKPTCQIAMQSVTHDPDQEMGTKFEWCCAESYYVVLYYV